MEKRKWYTIQCKDMDLHSTCSAYSEVNAAHIFADKHFMDFYPPYQIDGVWHVQNANIIHRFKVVEKY